jgi:hypothetical protein
MGWRGSWFRLAALQMSDSLSSYNALRSEEGGHMAPILRLWPSLGGLYIASFTATIVPPYGASGRGPLHVLR